MRAEETRSAELNKLQEVLGYRYKDESLLYAALTHSSYANEKGLPKSWHNERLEFLGDAVLEMITSEFLYREYTEYPEGTLTRMRAALVKGQAWAVRQNWAGEIPADRQGEEQNGGRKRVSILADTLEAIIGSMYLDGGYAPARDFVLRYIRNKSKKRIDQSLADDYKTNLQEIVQASGRQEIEYRLVAQKGPDHDKTFRVRVLIGDRIYGEGDGKSKKEAEQRAAKMALEKLEG